ncbi:alpha/beta fold hydrolase [Pyruvatibacter sp.]|uniref:alpha/beta fold hydrolase n=1 Tax=Pyruvatibacter sp. TaxID=1981328 RepID=UPI0032EF8606
MATLVLVHGAWHGGWCWDTLVPLLEAQGHTVIAPDLPGHDTSDGAPATTTLEDYGRAVAAVANAQSGPVVLVGHSMGGGVITQAASYSTNLAGLVYVAAFVPQHGDSIAALAGSGPDSELNDYVDLAPTGTHTTIREGGAAIVFYGHCAPDAAAAAADRLIPQAITPLTDALEDPYNAAMTLPAFGIICTDDKAVHPDLQRVMCGERGMPTFDLDTDHSPFMSMPETLADTLSTALSEMDLSS